MKTVFDLIPTPADAEISISFCYLFPVIQWHKSKDCSKVDVTLTPGEVGFDIEKTGEQEWIFYLDMTLEYEGYIGQGCRFGFKISGCNEYSLYAPGMLGTIFRSSRTEFYNFLKKYAIENNIIHLPFEGNLTPESFNNMHRVLIDNAEKNGFFSFMDLRLLSPCIVIQPDNEQWMFVVKTTDTIIFNLLYNTEFDNHNNGLAINQFISISRVKTILHKCSFKYENNTIALNTIDTINLLILIEMSIQCVVGQIWFKLKEFMTGFDEKAERRFMNAGRENINSVILGIGNPTITNITDPPDWDSMLG